MLKTGIVSPPKLKAEDQGQGSRRDRGGNGKVNKNNLHGLPAQLQAPFPAPGLLPSLRCPSQPWLHSRACSVHLVHNALLEVASEGVTLVAPGPHSAGHLTLQKVIHLCGVDGSRPLLVWGLADPVMNVIGQVAACLVDLGREHVQWTQGPGLPQPYSRLSASNGLLNVRGQHHRSLAWRSSEDERSEPCIVL